MYLPFRDFSFLSEAHQESATASLQIHNLNTIQIFHSALLVVPLKTLPKVQTY